MNNNAMIWFAIGRHTGGNITTGDAQIDLVLCIILLVLLATPVLVPVIYCIINKIGDWIDRRKK